MSWGGYDIIPIIIDPNREGIAGLKLRGMIRRSEVKYLAGKELATWKDINWSVTERRLGAAYGEKNVETLGIFK